mmetsp:Transcript_6774/g.14969  ORF Transcript_6774/g.14969 Transcript_6774/m.14969 type:complete len:315 (-) Transcript_6774:1104-2048(-)
MLGWIIARPARMRDRARLRGLAAGLAGRMLMVPRKVPPLSMVSMVTSASRCMACSRVKATASSANGSPCTAGLPFAAGCGLDGVLMPEGANTMQTPSLGICSLRRCPLSTYSTTASILPARWKNGRYCLALVALPGRDTSLMRLAAGSLVLWMPRLLLLASSSHSSRRSYTQLRSSSLRWRTTWAKPRATIISDTFCFSSPFSGTVSTLPKASSRSAGDGPTSPAAGTLRVYSILTSTSRPIKRLRRNSLASVAQGSAGRSRVDMRGARRLDSCTRRSTPLAESLMTKQSPDTISTTLPLKFMLSLVWLVGAGT